MAEDAGRPPARRRALPWAWPDVRAEVGRYAVVLVLGLMIVVFSVLRPETFFSVDNFKAIAVTQSVLLVLALGVMVALAAGEFDLSVAAVLGFTGGLLAYLTGIKGWSPGAAIAVTLAAALAIGTANGVFVVRFGVNSFITTLGTGTLVTGIATAIFGAITIGGVPTAISDPVRADVLGLGAPFFYALALTVLLWYVLEYTPLGRYLFFTGEAREAARLAGVRVNRLRFGALVVSALCAWLAGLLLVGQTGAANATFGNPFLLPAFAAGFLGATTIKPGRYNAWGTFVGVYLLAVGTTGLQLLGAADWVSDVFNGGALVLAVTLARLVGRES
jgi:ribose transport system permease protein